MTLRNQKGLALFFVLMFFLTAAFALTSLGNLGGSHLRHANHHLEATKAFYLMEAAAEKAKNEFNTTGFYLTPTGTSATVSLGDGEYYYDIASDPDGDPTKRLITGYGAVPDFANPATNRTVEVFVRATGSDVPSGFWDYVIWSAGDITANGNSYDINGNIISGGDIIHQHDNITGNETEDPVINPLAALNWEALQNVAAGQTYNGHDNYYTADEIAAGDFPTSFYYVAPDPGNPDDVGVPHVLFIEGDLAINFDIGGFILVVGNILEDSNAVANVSLNGNRTVDGVVYALGTFTCNGGGNSQNLNGAIFNADSVTINGGLDLDYNSNYMDALENLVGDDGFDVLSWNEVQSEL